MTNETKQALITAALNLSGATLTHAGLLPIPDTTPQMYVAYGEAEQLRELAEDVLVAPFVGADTGLPLLAVRPTIGAALSLDSTLTDFPEIRADIVQAVSQGWCTPENAHKVMDADLAIAICRNVQALASRPAAHVSAPTDEVTQEQAVLLAGIQALCISTNQELSRRDGSLSEFDKGWFLGQLHIFDMYTPVEKGALNEAREYLRAITSAQAPQQTMRSLYEIQRDAAESAIGDDLARLMLVDPAGKAK